MKKILIASGIVLGLICSLALLNVRVHAVDIYVLTGTVRNPSNQPVSQVKVTATTPGTPNVVGSATLTDATGKYNLSMASGNYDIYFSPPAGIRRTVL